MTVRDENIFHPTESLILREPRRHYRAKVSPIHWQLRSLIGVSKRDHVYFPTGKDSQDIRKLNTATREAETIKHLTFSPRCLVAANGWVCCGGEHGEFSAIRLDDGGESQELRLDFDPDERLPLDLDSPAPSDAIFSLLSRTSRRRYDVKSKKFGKERVNCITLWFPPALVDAFAGAYTTPVAILANNDKHVTTVDLESDSSDFLDEISYPDCVNRAVISPDGRLLIAICDDPYLYIHERVEKEVKGSGPFRSADRPEYEWRSFSKIHLKGQKKGDNTNYRGSFAACFSSTGRYLAVGTQYGMICIFDVGLLHEPDEALITYFASSTDSTAGAIREMAFCPGPFDLLAWSEDQGTVGIADVRAGFMTRQILRLGEQPNYEHINLTEKSPIDPYLLNTRPGRSDEPSSLAQTLGISSSERPSPRSDALEQFQTPLTADETQVLEALQEHRRRRERDVRSPAQEYLGTRSPWSRTITRTPLATDNTRSRERSASVSRTVTDLLGNVQAQRERLQEAQQRLRDRELADVERRRSAVQGGRQTDTFSRLLAETEAGRAPSRESLLSRILSNSRAGGGWDNLEALYNLSVEPGGSSEALRADEAEANARRDRANIVSSLISQVNVRNLDDEISVFLGSRRRTGGHGNQHGNGSSEPTRPDDTSGLAWSEDGRILYAGAEDGIYEFHVNITARKLYPSITMR
ncbi:uncharacterized protein E0L32_004921 [Thyridium curvatum]|uniref:DUF2415 domain-containing protein n=1 Tax=Thyridium curvatum TaxID=1093900 RepID=A0A507BDT0_9PEZI|nr:uncharacterized protein E0L32_004921 [Thyridium curvatum]TPX15091.1 hypothetical protein E0L32_004921 [Thyridium curvatum]